MENPLVLIVSLSNRLEALKLIFYKSKKIFKINLIICFISYFYVGFQLFFQNPLLNYFNYTLGWIFCAFYFVSSYLILEIILIEFGVWKKRNLSKYKSYVSSKAHLDSVKKKFNITSKFEEFHKELNPIKTTLIKNENKINKLNIEVFKNERIQPNILTKNQIKLILKQISGELFENLNINSFMNFLFEGNYEKKDHRLNSDEKDNLIAVIILFRKADIIIHKGAGSKLSRLLIKYLSLDLEVDSLGKIIRKGSYIIKNINTRKRVELQIQNIKEKNK
ncbi:hypothetical protein CW731_06210 [Polaribacter sp. ALD11]|uniref:hypothetical protein n=1 Tax=Polaribacter sp. ALD11 TaxID=2058137 RepID=UPI000C3046FA|nr:hypothetical protein [Polaribacter sp. ALD11]AUC84909.1 hypothetical protein CW731_06210 [Polaribacter sp. ALD11]